MIRPLMLAGVMLAALWGQGAGAQTIAITNARVLTMGAAGDVARGTVLVRNGTVVAVGPQVAVPADARVVDAQGQFVTPGLVLAPTPLALKDLIGNGGTRFPTVGDLSAAYEVAGDFNPKHPHVAEARAEGVTHALLTADQQREGRLFAGQAALVQLGENGEPVIDPRAALYVSATEEGSRAAAGGSGGLRVRLKRVFADARDYARNPAGFDLARLEDTGMSRADLAAVGAVVAGREPLLVEVNRAEAIRQVLQLAREENIRLVLSGVSEGWLVAGEIARAKVPVIIDGEVNQAVSFEDINATYENAALLTKAGVLVAFKPTFSRVRILDRSPRWTAGRAARFGLTLHDAVAAITINPARILGIADRYGSIAVGRKADLVVWSGDPLETTTSARLVMIDGVEQNLSTRMDELRNRYMPADVAPAAR